MNEIYIEMFYALILIGEINMSGFGLEIQREKDQKGIVISPF